MIAHRHILLVAACASLGACVSGPSEALTHGDSARPFSQTRGERLLIALHAAESAERAGAEADLLAALEAIEALGARPGTDADLADLERWRAAVAEKRIPMRGRTLGPAYRSGRLAPGQVMAMEQTFLGGEAARGAISSRGEQALGMRVFDGSSKSVCSQVASSASCRWLPLFTQRHRIELENPGRAPVEYHLAFE